MRESFPSRTLKLNRMKTVAQPQQSGIEVLIQGFDVHLEMNMFHVFNISIFQPPIRMYFPQGRAVMRFQVCWLCDNLLCIRIPTLIIFLCFIPPKAFDIYSLKWIAENRRASPLPDMPLNCLIL